VELIAAWEAGTGEERSRLGPDLEAALAADPGAAGVAERLAELDERRSVAATYLAAILDARRAGLAAEHPDVLDARVALAYARRDSAALAAVLADSLRALGARHAVTAHARLRLAQAYERDEDFPAARHLLRRAIPDAVRTLGPDHRRTVGLRLALIAVYERDTVRYASRHRGALRAYRSLLGAQRQYHRTIESLERVHGPGAPIVLAGLERLADLYERMGALGPATAQYEYSLQWHELRHGPDAPETRAARDALARFYLRGRHPERAVPLYGPVAGSAEPDAPEEALDDLAEAHLAAGDEAAAQEVYERMLALLVARDGADAPETVRYLAEVGEAFDEAGAPGRAVLWHERVVATLSRAEPRDDEALTLARLHLATARDSAARRR
jgi:hypothetical protein